MPQAVCTGCHFRLELPSQVSLDRVRCPRCQGALAAAAPTPPVAPVRTGPPRSPRPSAPPTPAKKIRLAGNAKPGGRDVEEEEVPEAAGMSQGMKFALILAPILALALVLILIAVNSRSADSPNDPNQDLVAGSKEKEKDRQPDGAVSVPPPDKGGLPPVRDGRQQQVQFLGAQGQGRRFAIIADRSGSMNSSVRFARPDKFGKTYMRSIDYLHEELSRTIRDIKPGCQFYISFFDNTIIPMPGADTWVEGGSPMEDLEAWIRGVQPRGGTNPLPGFQKVLALDPPPDVIFFMTDGGFKDIRTIVADLNNRLPRKAVIHSIEFSPARATSMGPGLRQARILKSFELPPEVVHRFESAMAPRTKVIPKGFNPKQMEEIALDSGGTFRAYAAGDPEKEEAKGGAKRIPLFASAGEITPFDPICIHRAACHCKTFDVRLEGGMEYHIDVAGAIDPHLYVGDTTGRIFGQAGASGFRIAAINFRAGVAGDYRITVTTSSPRATGTFAITVIPSPL